MEKAYDLIIKGVTQGKIEKELAIQLVTMLRRDFGTIGDDVAIIGMSTRQPFSADIKEFWENISNKMDCVGRFPESRQKVLYDYLFYHVGDAAKNVEYLKGAYLDSIDRFDYKFFRLSPKEASLMDPSQRIFLQTVWEAIEDAGYGGKKLVGSKTGVYVGYNTNLTYQNMISEVDPSSLPISVTGNKAALMPSRISHLLDLKGPAMILDTTCSSSSVSLHLACQALKSGDCEMAIAAGVRLNVLPIYDDSSELGVIASDGRIRTFDDNAGGMVWGEGVVSLLLKPLSKARKDKDNIHAVIKGTAINHDGTSMSITAPNMEAQAGVILQAWQNANVHPETISYIEAHGTGTNLGDPLETEGLKEAFRKHTDKKQFCAISSVKTNIGHLYECAGLTGLVKAVMALKSGIIPPSIHFNRPNRKIDFYNSPFYVNTVSREWIIGDTPRRCGVSSFGLNGTNSHVVLEEYNNHVERTAPEPCLNVLALSAKSRTALKALIARYGSFIKKETDSDIRDICFTANTGRGHYAIRLAVIINDINDFEDKIKKLCKMDFSKDCEPWFFYREHRVVWEIDEGKRNGNLTERERNELSSAARVEIRKFTAAGKRDLKVLSGICGSYVKGADIEWDDLYCGESCRRISLPVYPFDEHVCWFDVTAAPKRHKKIQDSRMHYTMFWRPEKLGPGRKKENGGTVLVLKDSAGMGDKIAGRLRGEGRNVVEAEIGDGFRRLDNGSYCIKGREDDYIKLIEAIKENKLSLIIHMCTLTGKEEISSLEDLKEHQWIGLYSLFYLVRAVVRSGIENDIDIVLISEYVNEVTGEEERINPENAPMLGLGKVVEKECPRLKCRSIDIDGYTGVDDMLTELDSDVECSSVAYRKGCRYVEEFDAIDVENNETDRLDIKEDGVYIITGGLGGIGLEFARYLASGGRVNIALLNRTKMPERKELELLLKNGGDKKLLGKLQIIREFQAKGAVVEFHGVDVSDMDEMSRVLGCLKSRYGRINGVIHSAGVSGDSFIVERDEGMMKDIISPKIYGTWVLDRLTSSEDMDFFVMFSSVATMFGMYGQGDYIAANSYLDSYAFYRGRQGKRTLTINWTTWKETGMAVDGGNDVDTIFTTLSNAKAIEGFKETINSGAKRVLVGEINFKGVGAFLLERSGVRLSADVALAVKEYIRLSGRSMKSRESKKRMQTGEVRLIGRDGGEYTKNERLVAQVWGEILGFEEISIFDNFFELGGDSILGVKIANSISGKIGRSINPVNLLKFLTVPEFGRYIDDICAKVSEEPENVYPQIEVSGEGEYYPASYGQKMMFMINRLEGPRTAYNMCRVKLIEGELDGGRFENALKALIDRHEVFRTSIELVNGEIVQRVWQEAEFEMSCTGADEASLKGIISSFKRPFDLGRPPLLRAELVKLKAGRYAFLYDMPHIVTDGLSAEIFNDELFKLYQGVKLPELRIQYKDFSVWQGRLMQSEFMLEQEKFWLGIFKDKIPLLNLPTDYPRPEILQFKGSISTVYADTELTGKIRKISAETGASLYMVLLAAYNILLSKYTAQDDIIVGCQVLGRPLKELEKLMGIFVNTLPLRNYPSEDKTIKVFLSEIKDNTLKAFENQDYHITELISKLNIPRSINRHPLFETNFVLQNLGKNTQVEDSESDALFYDEHNLSDYDLELEAVPWGEAIRINLQYNTYLFKRETTERILQDYLGLLESITGDREVRIGDMELGSGKLIEPTFGEDEDVVFNL